MKRSAGELAAIAGSLYPGPGLADRLQRSRPLICPFEELLPHIPAGARVLDLGCGSGLLLGLLARTRGVRAAIGVDPSPPAVARARRMAARLRTEGGSAPEFLVGDEGSVPPGTFDVVTAVDVLHHVPVSGQREFVRAAARRVAPGGALLYKDLAPRPWWRAFANRVHDLAVSRQWVQYVELDAVRRWAGESGLLPERDVPLPRLWYAHHLLVLRRPERP